MDQFPVPDESAAHWLDLLVKLGLLDDEPLKLRLFVNDVIPQRGATIATFTEATFTGYSERVLMRSDWSAAVLGVDHVARIQLSAGPLEWTPTGALQTVYGVFLVSADATKLRLAFRFVTPRDLSAGVPLRVMPVITLASVAAV